MLRASSRWTTRQISRPGFSKLLTPHSLQRYATVTDLNNYPKPGDSLLGFTLQRAKHVPELQLTAIHLQHNRTGAEYVHIAKDDTNNVFSIGFKTNPPDDTGVPHILEHTTLCGGEKYPVRDPFFKMMPRSLSNFMNAFTSADHTTYPFATTNQKDFKNLLSVYLDATLKPLLKEDDFTQEGWRIGPENPLGVDGETGSRSDYGNLVFKGVVYNEMKGQMSDASYLYYIRFRDHIFPEIHNSGGDPSKMTDLTYRMLKDFHQRNYHPSNAKLLTYGNMPLRDHIQEIGRQLDYFEESKAEKEIKLPLDLSKGPMYHTVKGPTDPLVDKDMQFKTSTSWLMGDTSNRVEVFSLGIISSLLYHGYGSPLYQALIEAGLGTDFSPNIGFDDSGKVGILSIGLSGVKTTDVPRIKEAIHSTLLEIYRKGFDKGKVDGLLHQLELSLKNKNANFGMELVQRLQPGWFNGVDPLDALAWDDTVNAFKHKYAESGYLEGLLEKYLLNDRTLTFTMEPSEEYGAERSAEEASRLESKISETVRSAGGEAEAYKRLTGRELELLEAQAKAQDQDLSCLPKVHVKDIPRQKEKKAVRQSSIGDVQVQWRENSTNGLTYFRAINNLQGLSANLRMLIPLFTDSIMRLGTRDKSMEELEDLIKLKTGGLRATYHSSPSPHDIYSSTEGIHFAGFALDKNIPAMYELLQLLVEQTEFDGPEAENKIRQLLQSDSNSALDNIAGSGHSFACRYTAAGLTTQGLLNEQTSGLTQVQQTASLASRDPSYGLSDIVTKLKAIQSFAMSNSSSFRIALTCGQESTSSNEAALDGFLTNLPVSAIVPETSDISKSESFSRQTFFPLPYQVYYTALAMPTVGYTHPLGAPLQVTSELLTHNFLHHEIREKGGAYGGGAYARGLSGLFGYHSYRDPNPKNTLRIMQDAGRWARDRDWTDANIEEAKLSIFQDVDAPQSVSDEGMTRFLDGVDEEMAQKRREQLLDVKKEEVRDVSQRFLVDGMENAKIAVIGEKKDWVNEGAGWTIKSLELSKPSEFAGASDLAAGDLDHA